MKSAKLFPLLVSLFVLLSAGAAQAQQTDTITGMVTDEATGTTLPGVNVVIEGTTQGAATDASGQYRITGVEPGTYTLIASFVGYAEAVKEDVEVVGGETTTVDFAMEPAALGLDEVVVVGYGQRQRQDLTGAIGSISTEELERAPATSVNQLLQGRVAGVQVTTNSSAPGGGISVRIRGTGSVTSGAEPLYVIDGVPIYGGGNVPGTGGNRVGPNPLAAINPQAIASMQVLKGPSATAIYGARGANGVVLITTKQGREGETTVNFSSHVSTQTPAKTYDVLNARQFVRITNEAGENRGLGRLWPDPPASYGEGTDWQDLVYEMGLEQSYNLSVRGGDTDTRYAVSGNFFTNDGVVTNSGFQRYMFRINLNQDVSDRIRVQTNLMASRAIYALINEGGSGFEEGVSTTAAAFFPTFGPFTEDGEYTDQSAAAPYSVFALENPLAFVREREDNTGINRFLGNAEVAYDVLENLTLQVSVGADIEDFNRERYQTRRLIRVTQDGIAETWGRSQRNLLNENLLKYNTTLGEAHDLDVTAGFTWQRAVTETERIQNADFVTDITKTDDIGAGTQPGGPNVASGRFEWTLLSWLGRVNYALSDKYLLTLTGRADGSSKFGAGNKWGFFPSGALAWRVSEEPFMQELDFVSNLKLRVGYGLSGNQSIGTYTSLARLGTVSYAFGGAEFVGYLPVSVANPNLKWEISQQFNVGVNLGLLGQRLRLTANYYRKNTSDLLLPVTLPYRTGFDIAIQNTGNVLNTGIELAVGADLIAGDFSWSSSANFSANRNEVTDLGESGRFFGAGVIPGKPLGSLVEEGRPIGVFWGLETNGIINTEEELEELGYGELGGVRVVDQDGDGAITGADQTVIGSPHPDFVYGWRNTFSYKGFELSAFLQGVYGNEVWNIDLAYLEFNTLSANSTMRRFEGRWTPENKENATFPKAGWVPPDGGDTRLDFQIQDASYLRLKSLTLSYTLPTQWIQATGARSARLYVQGGNLFTITDYYGPNPDVNSFGQGTINTGYAHGAYPLVREYTVGVNLTF